jgi:hypothetical protein
VKTRLQSWFTITSFPVAVGLLAGTLSATINDVTGDAILMAPPPSVVPGASFGDTSVIHSFVEQRDIALPVSIAVDLAPGDPPSLEIAAGTCVSSHFVHYDPPIPSTARGGIRFEQRILGVIVTQASLDASNDVLGGAGTSYGTVVDCLVPPLSGDCGLETIDAIDVQRQRIDLEFHASGPGDRVRVITEGDPAECP